MMNMKKIIAATLASVMALSTVAFAATSSADVAGLNPTWTFSEPVQLTAKADVQALTSFAFAKNFDDATYDYYKVTYQMTDLGPLKNEYAEDVIGIYNITLGMKTSAFQGGVKTAAVANTESKIGQSAVVGETDWFNYTFTATGGTANPYPKMNEDSGEQDQPADGTLAIDTVLVVAEGASVTVDTFQAKIVYVTDAGTAAVTNVNLPASLTVGGKAQDLPVVFTPELKEDKDNGYIWALTFTQSADKVASLEATFTADGASITRSVQNAAALASALAGKTAPVVLNVGLSTTKTLTAASFTADDAVDTTDACTQSAAVSK